MTATAATMDRDKHLAEVGEQVEKEFMETGRYPLPEPIKRFSWGAFFMAPLWGAMHGQWMMILIYPMWVMVDSMIRSAVYRTSPLTVTIAVLVSIGMMAFTIWYAFSCQKPAYWRVHNKYTPEEYAAREKKIAIAFAALAIVFVIVATYYNLVIYPASL